jgi:hypothetical protein
MKIPEAFKNGSGAVSYRTFYVTLAILCATAISAEWQVMRAHAEDPHVDAASVQQIEKIEERLTTAVEKSEGNLNDKLDRQYEEQKSIDSKLEWIIQQMVESANARGNTQ